KLHNLGEAARLIEPNLELIWPRLPEHQRKRLLETYFLDVIVQLTVHGYKSELLERAVDMTKRLSILLAGRWWAGFLHNMGRYEESCDAFRAAIASEPRDPWFWRVLVHNLADHIVDLPRALEAIDDALAKLPDEPVLQGQKAEILDKLGRI